MFASLSNPRTAYNRVAVDAKVIEADPHQLIQMLYEGAQTAITSAIVHMQRGEVQAKGQAISKAIDIISSGLHASLDHEQGGELAERLGALYDYICTRLVLANAQNSVPALEETHHLLGELKDAWESIRSQVRSGT
ncbi:MAG: flagellar export chaperone FliS [Rhodocyclaceae bacterium]|nr:flagellar export chaperone FliS [Rhodocyclaceae bacterium]MBX3668629.1 flagellar export chaperone FliS [Rhodocyclaceae bacterium]